MNKDSVIFVAGHNGMVGSAVIRSLKRSGFKNILIGSRDELDLSNYNHVEFFFKNKRIDIVYNCAAKVGGIIGNRDHPGDYILQNLLIQNNLFQASLKHSVNRFVFLGSSCIYPKNCSQPMKEEYILSGLLEPTNEAYAVAKIAGIITAKGLSTQYKMKSVCPMPTNLYGPGDNWHPENSHVIPGLMRRFHFAKINNEPSVYVWGSGKVKREFMHVDDCANAIIFITDKFDNGNIVNIAPGEETTTREIAEIIAKVVGYNGKLIQDTSKPDGTHRKLLSSEIMHNLGGWKPRIKMINGLKKTYQDFKLSIGEGRGLKSL